ncbi:MAG TPA: CdaR family protein [Planctomycetota bacterium]|nr:CdaR family protein [Planctomycetota bacterium]HRR81806.1 CdaR family protein [Planctomycetota bacterium]HRT96084.1 CdaR family protein [Planctomycetota bacterium]
MRSLFRALLRHLDLKLAALLLAAATWYYGITAGIDERRFVGVVVRAINPPQDVALGPLVTRTVNLVLRGPRRDLDTLKTDELFVVVDLKAQELSGGELQLRVPLATHHVRSGRDAETAERLPAGLVLVRAEPDVAELTLDRVREVLLDVEVVTEGEPGAGLTLKKTVQPPKVKVRGAFRLLQRLSTIRTEPIRVDGLRERLQRRVALQRQVVNPEFQTAPIATEPESVDVVLDVVATPEEKTIERVPVRLTVVPGTVAVVKEEVREVAVRLSGPRQVVREIDAPSLVAEVSLEGAQAPARGTEVTTVFLRRENIRQLTPAGLSAPLAREVELLEVRPRAIPLTLDRVGTRTLPVRPVREGVPAEDYEVSEVTVVPDKVTVRGPETVLKELKAVDTMPVAVTGLRERLRRTVRLVETVDAEPFRGVRIEPSQQLVDVVIAVAERREEKTLTGLPVHVLVRPEVALNVRIETSPRTVGPVAFVGPRSRMEHFGADDVTAFVLLDLTGAADLRPTLRNVEFHIRDSQVRLAPDTKPISIKIDFPPPERGVEAPGQKQ